MVLTVALGPQLPLKLGSEQVVGGASPGENGGNRKEGTREGKGGCVCVLRALWG